MVQIASEVTAGPREPPRMPAPAGHSRTRKLHKRLHTRCTFDKEQVGLNENASTCGAFAEPSDGLEPSTPSLPWNVARNWSQPTATVLACFRRFRAQSICR